MTSLQDYLLQCADEDSEQDADEWIETEIDDGLFIERRRGDFVIVSINDKHPAWEGR